MPKDHWRQWIGPVAVAAGLAGVGFRCWLVTVDALPTNSDEATFGLVALHVLRGADFPIFLYGQHYMGTLESYVAAPLISLVGPTTYALRIGPLVFFALFLATMYFTVRRLHSPGLAAFTVAILALGSDRVVKDQIIADGSAELGLLAALLILLAALSGAGQPQRVLLISGLWGVTAGLALWDHMLVLPYLAGSAAVLWYGCGPVRRRAGLAAFVGFLLGAMPMLVHNVTAQWKDNSLSVLLHYNTVGADAPLFDRLYGGIMVGIPLATGLCEPSDCRPWQTWWGPVYLGLLAVSGFFAIVALRLPGADRVKELSRLALVFGALVTVGSYARSPAAATDPIESARYLALLLVSTPAILWPLWMAVSRSRARLSRMSAMVPLAALVAAMSSATVALIAHTPSYRLQDEQQRELLQAMHQLGVTRYYTGYWTCNRLAYATHERAVCAVLSDDLRLGFNRYVPYRDMVRKAKSVAYLAPANSAFDINVQKYLRTVDATVTVTEVAGYRIYIPDRAIHPPSQTTKFW